jgi:hypothetical protein
LKSGLGEVKAVVQTLRNSHDTPTLNHTHLAQLESMVKQDSERNMAIQFLKKEVTAIHGEMEGIKKKAKQEVMLVHQDGSSSLQGVGGRNMQRDSPPSLSRERNAG